MVTPKTAAPVTAFPRLLLVAFLVAGVLVCAACDDPVPGPVGGLVLTIRSLQAADGSRFAEVRRVVIEYDRVEALHRAGPEDGATRVVLDSQPRRIELDNESIDWFVAQFQVPVGLVDQLRFSPVSVTIELRDGSIHPLELDSPSLPSWRQSGWKLVPNDGSPLAIAEDELTGARGLMDFDDRLVAPAHSAESQQATAQRWKMKPTLPMETWQVNPEDDAPGVFADQVTVIFDDGVSREQVDAINTGIGATVLRGPMLVNVYRLKLPATTNMEDALAYYRSRDEALSALPSVNYGLTQYLPNDGEANSLNYSEVRLQRAWERALEATGQVGHHVVEVAVVEASFDPTHRDLYRNVGINQEMLPLAIFDPEGTGEVDPGVFDELDCDPADAPDGIITMRDIECWPEELQPPRVDPDRAYPAAVDLLEDPRWTADDRFDPRTGLVNDLVGWNFILNNNRPFEFVDIHATAVAGILAAEGDNNLDTAGVAWRVSLVQVAAGLFGTMIPDHGFLNAIAYLEARGVDVANVSMGLDFVCKRRESPCMQFGGNLIMDIDRGVFESEVEEAVDQWRSVLRDDGQNLYVFGAGNSALNNSNPCAITMPQAAFQHLAQDRTLVVGATWLAERGQMAFNSNYGEPRVADGIRRGVDIYAPGHSWTTLVPSGGTYWDGGVATSWAAPVVSGAAALLASVAPRYRRNGPALRRAILETARPEVLPFCRDAPSHQPLLAVDRLIDRGLDP